MYHCLYIVCGKGSLSAAVPGLRLSTPAAGEERGTCRCSESAGLPVARGGLAEG